MDEDDYTRSQPSPTILSSLPPAGENLTSVSGRYLYLNPRLWLAVVKGTF